jgi:hypothetical protein
MLTLASLKKFIIYSNPTKLKEKSTRLDCPLINWDNHKEIWNFRSKLKMKKMVFTSLVLFLLAGCAQTGQQKSPEKAEKKPYKGIPVELHLQDDDTLPVNVQTKDNEPVPVKVIFQDDTEKPVKVQVKTDEALHVEAALKSDKALPVEIKLPHHALIFIAIYAAAILLIALVACFASIAAARSAKAASQSTDEIKKLKQQSEPPAQQPLNP